MPRIPRESRHSLVTGSYGHVDGQLRYPNGLALSSDHGTLFVADSGNTRIVALDATDLAFKFTFLLECSAPPSMRHRASSPRFPMPSQPRQACRPAGLAVFGAELYVVDAFNRRLQASQRPTVPSAASSCQPSLRALRVESRCSSCRTASPPGRAGSTNL